MQNDGTSAPAALSEEASVSSIKERLTEANARRHTIETAIAGALALLQATPVGLTGPLVDEEGFPRGDVDLYAVREARHTVATGRNDLRAVQDQLHELLGDLHEATAESAKKQMDVDSVLHAQRKREVEALQRKQQKEAAMRQMMPFLRVEAITDGSPAFTAGLRVDDEIVSIGGIDAGAFLAVRLPGLAKEVADNEGLVLTVWASRSSIDDSGAQRRVVMELPLVPQRWRGEGLVGCKFTPL
ncbi:proteasome 26s non-ATPase subunit, putative [Bodo saltans]|uniref:Proteasome 26s non-ATPase subunit, putative n=1 Tax=Bodo saltans TaxID=75058 RepID=A0A0S4ITV9_BODSA|nr:proteasome 26s non-ATPase subunit, putative [Bodo saltans]|eukprot:CUE80079.1 proteasome 26s non-ATPase subunit, putative [Bodo saltans]